MNILMNYNVIVIELKVDEMFFYFFYLNLILFFFIVEFVVIKLGFLVIDIRVFDIC